MIVITKININKIKIKDLNNIEEGISLKGSITYELTNEYLKAQSKIEDTMLEKWELKKEDLLKTLDENRELKERIKNAIERLRGLQLFNNSFGASISSGALEDVIKCLDGRLDEILKRDKENE